MANAIESVKAAADRVEPSDGLVGVVGWLRD